MNTTLLLIILSIISIIINAQEESILNMDTDNNQDLLNQIEFDGLVLKINEVVFESVMKKINFAIIFFYDDNCNDCDRILGELKIAAQQIVKLKPPVGVFKMKCSENRKFCTDIQKDEVPYAIWINNDNFGYFNDKSAQNFISTAEKMSKFSKIKTIENIDDLTEFQSNKNYYRVLGIFPHNNTISNEKAKIIYVNSQKLEECFENIVPDSFLLKSGEFVIGKITDFKLLDLLTDISIIQPTILLYSKEGIIDFANLFSLSQTKLKEYITKYPFISQFNDVNVFSYNLNNLNITTYCDKVRTLEEIVLNAILYGI